MTETGPPFRLRSRSGRLALCVAAVALFTFPPSASAVILIEVIGPLILFEIEGTGFDFYATSNGTRLRVRDSDAGHPGIVNLQGQPEWRSELSVCAFSRVDPRQKVRIRIDVAPLRGRATGRFFVLDAWGEAVGPVAVTDPALAALEGPLTFGFALEGQTRNPDARHWFAVYRLHSVEPSEGPRSD